MTDFSGKEYWLYKGIEEEFRESVDPWVLLVHIKECLTEEDVTRFKMIREEEKYRMHVFMHMYMHIYSSTNELWALELFDRLTKRPNWIQVLLKACKLPDSNLEHLAELVKEMEISMKKNNSIAARKDEQGHGMKKYTSTDVNKDTQVLPEEMF